MSASGKRGLGAGGKGHGLPLTRRTSLPAMSVCCFDAAKDRKIGELPSGSALNFQDWASHAGRKHASDVISFQISALTIASLSFK